MKKYTCFLVEGIVTSISSHTNQCAIVIMVALLKANFKKGRVVTGCSRGVDTEYPGAASILLSTEV